MRTLQISERKAISGGFDASVFKSLDTIPAIIGIALISSFVLGMEVFAGGQYFFTSKESDNTRKNDNFN